MTVIGGGVSAVPRTIEHLGLSEHVAELGLNIMGSRTVTRLAELADNGQGVSRAFGKVGTIGIFGVGAAVEGTGLLGMFLKWMSHSPR